MADSARRGRGRLHLVSKFHPGANLCPPPPRAVGKKPDGRPREGGAELPAPQVVALGPPRRRRNAAWCGGGRRDVEVVSGRGHWCRGGAGPAEVRRAFVRDPSGTHRDEYFYATDLALTPAEVIERYAERWDVGTTSAEMRSYPGLGATRGRRARTVPRAGPCLFGLHSVAASPHERSPAGRAEVGVGRGGKAAVTLSDATAAVRRWLWAQWAFGKAGREGPSRKRPEPLRQAPLHALAPAA
jgi:hypothetical protein